MKTIWEFNRRRKPAQTARSSILDPRSCVVVVLVAMLAGCGSVSRRDTASTPPTTTTRGGGGYYLDDGPGANPPANLDSIPDAVPRAEPIRAATARPYVVMGRSYAPMTQLAPYKARGVATWYGRRYHGKQTSSGEIYDMYAMTAAHTTLPIPSYARVTNLANGKSVVVRINDRGPFVDNRLIDLSYAAAHRIGVLAGGSAMVEVETIIPGTVIASAPREATPAVPKPEPAPVAATPDPVAAPPVPAIAAPAVQIPVTTETAGFYLQLGAFGSKDNAESFLARMKAQMAEIADGLHVYARDGLFRVHAGPYANDVEARRAADRIAQALGVRPFVLTR